MVYLYRILNEFFLLTCTGFHQKWITWDGWKVKKNNTIKYLVNIKLGFICWCHFLPLPLIFFYRTPLVRINKLSDETGKFFNSYFQKNTVFLKTCNFQIYSYIPFYDFNEVCTLELNIYWYY